MLKTIGLKVACSQRVYIKKNLESLPSGSPPSDQRLLMVMASISSLWCNLFSPCHKLIRCPPALQNTHQCTGLTLLPGPDFMVTYILLIVVSIYLPDCCHSGLKISHHSLPSVFTCVSRILNHAARHHAKSTLCPSSGDSHQLFYLVSALHGFQNLLQSSWAPYPLSSLSVKDQPSTLTEDPSH